MAYLFSPCTPVLMMEKEFKTIYAINKYACENYLKMYQESFGIDYVVFRICVPYGNIIDNSLSFGTLGHMISKAEKGENITLYSDGSQKRSLIHAQDLAALILKASIEKDVTNDIFNIGGPDVLSIKEIAEMISKVYDVNIEYISWPEEHLKIESGDTIFDSSKLMSKVDYVYRYNFIKWIESLCN
ncbi:GDP-L-fucose synthase [subsurface metagenome]